MTGEITHGDTRQRLLDAACQVFAERGFDGASVRDIVERAGANVAAVNYHFGSKEGLYLEVLRGTCRASGDKLAMLGHDGPPEQRILGFVQGFLQHLLRDANPWQGRLFARELYEPTAALDTIVNDVVRPISVALTRAVKEVAEQPIDDATALLCAQSIIAQCVFQKHNQAVILRLDPHAQDDLEALAEHIAGFSLAGIRARAAAVVTGPDGRSHHAAESDRSARRPGKGTRR